jgi:protein involved in polysaccharide export with SLBB domain
MTLEGPDGKRYLVHRDGSLVLPGNGPVRLADLTPESRAIVEALLRGRESATKAAAVGEPDTAHRGEAE